MKAVVLYRPNTDHERTVIDYARDYERQTGRKLEMVSLDTPDGAERAKVYDVTQYPAILAMDDSGHLLQMWQGEPFPLIRDVSYYQSGQART